MNEKSLSTLEGNITEKIDKNINVNFSIEKIEKRNSIRSRLQKIFLLVTLLIITIMSTFSLGYFYLAIKQEAEALIRNKIQLTEVFLEAKKNDLRNFSRRIASDKALQVGLDLGNTKKISEYIFALLKQNQEYYVTIFSKTGEVLADIGKTDSPVFKNRKNLSASDQLLLEDALKGTSITDTVLLSNGLNEKFLCYAAFTPVIRNNTVFGVVAVRFVFSDNKEYFTRLSKNLGADIAVYVDNEAKIKTADLSISKERYTDVANLRKNYEDINLTGGGLHQYRGIFSNRGEPIGVLQLYISSLPYMKTFITALLVYILLAIVMAISVGFVVVRVSKSIINPIEQLLQSVNIVRSGDLAHEIILSVKDEIGRLGGAFNEMRSQLNEKISTIQSMNSSLERTIEERTETINTLNKKMKRYLSPQLYASIAGGKRDASVKMHFRKKLTIFFSDVVNFTSTTESLEPEDLSNLLNSYLDRMAQIALQYGGTIDKYVGDAIMVFFGDPEFTSDKDHALRAVKMAMEMLEALSGFQREWKEKGLDNPFHVRIGINTGYCTIGNFGSETKMDYTIIGNNVNLAARYEAAAKPDSILLSHETYMLIHDEIECKEAGVFNLKGIQEPVKAYTPIRFVDQTINTEILSVSADKKLMFPEKPFDLAHLTPAEKRSVLVNIKNIFDNIKKQ